MIEPPALAAHMRYRVLTGDHIAAHVHFHRAVPHVHIGLHGVAVPVEERQVEQRGLVMQNINSSEMIRGMGNHCSDGIGFTCIELNCDGGFAQFVGNALRRLFA